MIGFLICTASMLAGAEQAAAPLADDVARLVHQLDARGLAERDAAERKLVELGAGVLPLLPAVGERTPPEVAQRIARVQQKLLSAQAQAAAEPTQVTLKGADLPLADVLAAIQAQTNNPIVDHRRAFGEEKTAARLTLDLDKTPFWRALDQVLDDAGLTLYSFTGQRGAFVINRPEGALPRKDHASYSGVFRLVPVRFEAIRDLRHRREQALKFYLEVSWEPRLQPIALLHPLSDVAAVGDDGGKIAVTNTQAEPEALIREGTSAAELEIPLELPERSVKTIRSLRGKLVALVPGPQHDFRFTALQPSTRNAPQPAVERRQAGATVTIDHVRKNNDVWEVGLRVKFDDPSNALESHRGWILENQAYFQDAQGKRVAPGGFEQTRQTRDEVGLNYYFDLDHGPDKLEFVYRTAVTILELTVDYDFRDLKLP